MNVISGEKSVRKTLDYKFLELYWFVVAVMCVGNEENCIAFQKSHVQSVVTDTLRRHDQSDCCEKFV